MRVGTTAVALIVTLRFLFMQSGALAVCSDSKKRSALYGNCELLRSDLFAYRCESLSRSKCTTRKNCWTCLKGQVKGQVGKEFVVCKACGLQGIGAFTVEDLSNYYAGTNRVLRCLRCKKAGRCPRRLVHARKPCITAKIVKGHI